MEVKRGIEEGGEPVISLKRRRAEKKCYEQKIVKQRDALLKEIDCMNAEAKRIRALPRDEIDALIAEMVGGNSNRI